MEDLVIDACKWHVDAESPPYKQRALEHFRDRYTVLLEFLRSEALLADPGLEASAIDWPGFEFRQSHLTDEGLALVKLCHGTWSPAFGQANNQRHLTQWKRKLAQLRAES